jgi:hypothetical protein
MSANEVGAIWESVKSDGGAPTWKKLSKLASGAVAERRVILLQKANEREVGRYGEKLE